jgi:hypothetical protein
MRDETAFHWERSRWKQRFILWKIKEYWPNTNIPIYYMVASMKLKHLNT